MSAVDDLRRAAALMRERAEVSTPGPWYVEDDDGGSWYVHDGARRGTMGFLVERRDAAHIASWHPAVALAVADWLEHAAKFATWRTHVGDGPTADLIDEATKVARAYLGADV